MNYFDFKRELKKLYGQGIKAIKRQDTKYANFLVSVLDQLKKELETANLDSFGKHVINKDIEHISRWLNRSVA